MRISKNNVLELWELYECYKKDYKRHSLSIKELSEMYSFEEYTDTVEQCSNCKKYFNNDESIYNQLALQDIICNECIENGYGR